MAKSPYDVIDLKSLRCFWATAKLGSLTRAGVTDLRWHDLRHTWASWHAQAGTPPNALQELGASRLT